MSEQDESIDALEARFKALEDLHNSLVQDEKALLPLMEEPVNVHEKKELWNLNAVAIVAWKTSIMSHQFQDAKDSHCLAQFFRKFIRKLPLYMFRLLPLTIVFLEVVLLSSIVDQSFQRKKFIDHDGVYQAKDIKYTQKLPGEYLESRSTQVQKDPTCEGSCEFTTMNRLYFRGNIMKERPEEEAKQCVTTSAALYAAIKGDESYVVANESATRLFTHCLPWEYAHVCVHVLQQLQKNPAAASTTDAAAAIVYQQCRLPWNPTTPGGGGRVSIQNWQSIAVTPDEVMCCTFESSIGLTGHPRIDLGCLLVGRLTPSNICPSTLERRRAGEGRNRVAGCPRRGGGRSAIRAVVRPRPPALRGLPHGDVEMRGAGAHSACARGPGEGHMQRRRRLHIAHAAETEFGGSARAVRADRCSQSLARGSKRQEN